MATDALWKARELWDVMLSKEKSFLVPAETHARSISSWNKLGEQQVFTLLV